MTTTTDIVEQAKEEQAAEDIRIVLDNLIALNRDATLGYQLAEKQLQDPTYQERCRACSAQRKAYVQQLSQTMARYGGEPPDSQEHTNVLHDSWIRIESMDAANDAAVMAACKRAEELAFELYLNALKEPLSDEIKILLRTQFYLLKTLDSA